MKVSNIFSYAVLALVVANITACTELNLPTGTTEVLAVSRTGDFVLLDAKGKPILSCEERENTNDKCRVPAEQFRKLCQTESQSPAMSDQKQVAEGPVIKDLKLGYCIFEYKVNPTCISYVNRITGQVYQICW